MFRVFCDFDGTLCNEDCGGILIDTAKDSNRKELELDVIEKKKTYREAVELMWYNVKIEMSDAMVLLEDVQLDIGSNKLREYLNNRGLPLYILSNNLDIVIEPILAREMKINAKNDACVEDVYLFSNYGTALSI